MANSINNFLSFTPTGLYCSAGDFYIDPKKPVHNALISHAHGDHAVPNSGNIYATDHTRLLMISRFKNAQRSRFHVAGYGLAFRLGDVKISFHSAGHILGSSQILMEHNGVRYLYTGDFKVQPDDTCLPIEFVKADILITETTFADPAYVHPAPEAEINRINDVADMPVMIGAYAIGKAQRITQLVSKYGSHRKIFVHHEISKYHAVYEQAGFNLGNWQVYNRQEFKDESDGIYIVPPRWLSRNSRNKKVYKVFATGWKKYYSFCDTVLHISDHADWNGILTLIERAEPSRIFTMHGDGSLLKEFLKERTEVFLLK